MGGVVVDRCRRVKAETVDDLRSGLLPLARIDLFNSGLGKLSEGDEAALVLNRVLLGRVYIFF